MDIDDLVTALQVYLKEQEGYESALSQAIEYGNRGFGSSGADIDRDKARDALKKVLDSYIDQRIGLFLQATLGHIKKHYEL